MENNNRENLPVMLYLNGYFALGMPIGCVTSKKSVMNQMCEYEKKKNE